MGRFLSLFGFVQLVGPLAGQLRIGPATLRRRLLDESNEGAVVEKVGEDVRGHAATALATRARPRMKASGSSRLRTIAGWVSHHQMQAIRACSSSRVVGPSVMQASTSSAACRVLKSPMHSSPWPGMWPYRLQNWA